MSPGGELVSAFTIGVLSTASPCMLPVYPGFISYLAAGGAGKRNRPAALMGLLVLAGVLVTMLVIGALTAVLSIAIGGVLAFVTPIADGVVIILGILLLAGYNVLALLPTIGARPNSERPEIGAFMYGVLYGPIALPCIAPLLVGVFGLSLNPASFAERLLFFVAFGLGLGVPLLILAALAAIRQTAVVAFMRRHERLIARIAGGVLVAAGAWALWNALPPLLLYLGV